MMSCLSSAFTVPLAMPNHSPEPHRSVDTFLTEILSAVTGDDSPLCSSCEEGISASSRCRDCSEMLCDPCVRAHQRVRITKDHRIIRFPNGSSSSSNGSSGSTSSTGSAGCIGSPLQTSTGPISASLANLALTSSNFCDVHHEPHRLFCESCPGAACTECALLEHRGHQLIYIQDAEESARNTSLRLSAETRSAMSAVREAIENLQRMSESIEIKSLQCATDIRSLVKRYVTAVEERERDLLKRVDHQRQQKNKALLSQMENLRLAMSKLVQTAELLNESMESASSLDVILANEKASEELKQIRCIRPELLPCEDDNFMFVAPDQNLLRAIANMGNICCNFVRNQKSIAEKLEGEIVQARGGVRGRAIHNCVLPVVARDTGGVASASFGTEGELDGQLCRPWGVCCDRLGNIIVADRSNNRVQMFAPNGSFWKKFGSQGTGPGQFDRPAGVAVDPLNRIVVADKDNHRIQIFNGEGGFLAMFGEKGCRNGQFNYPWDVAVNAQGQIVVSDTRNHRIQLFTNEGVFINKYGFEGTATMWKHFDSPRGVCFNPAGSVIVTDFNNHRLVIIDPNFSHAQFLGQEGSGFKQFLRPQGICCDDEGRIIVADSRNNRIQVFESNGTFLWKMGVPGKASGELDRPSGICVSPDGRIIVVDFGNNRVQIF